MAKQGKDGQAGKPAKEGKLVTDSRFAAVHYDPRFQRFPKAKGKVEIDERFAGELPSSRLQAVSAMHVWPGLGKSECGACARCRHVQGSQLPSEERGGQAWAQGKLQRPPAAGRSNVAAT